MANILSVNLVPSGVYIGHQAVCDLLDLTYDSGTLTAYKGTKTNACFQFSVDSLPYNITTCYDTTINSSYNVLVAATNCYLHYLITTNGVVFGINNSSSIKSIQFFVDKTIDGLKYVYGNKANSDTTESIVSIDGEGGLYYTNNANGFSTNKAYSTDFVNLNNLYLRTNKTIIQNIFIATCFLNTTQTTIFTLDGTEYISFETFRTQYPPLVLRIT